MNFDKVRRMDMLFETNGFLAKNKKIIKDNYVSTDIDAKSEVKKFMSLIIRIKDKDTEE